ncbi:phosphotransferase family protein [Salinicoccus roseus]|uniref:Phosphotransferase n=1 Tax=Salinicoccus roseus TaxID=45670 RepID=A0A0C2DJ52_9STAP|nr:phosphotransferase family protein [Salinicoccus roseus]KIH69993.1 phosphotransferase [Salinicoccus roseus]MCG7332265.1 phosphotransferase family protein [Salinicoccus roseus]MDB0581294.1 phosphotransferase family protein [Salinicoccus roseus]OZT77827.1 phosphotransferase [Salinicoccus roseus]RPE53881.1 thiamine kinase-like enzyme [Salinicoccus roseus]
MEHFYQLGWTLDPVGGASGEAYKAEQDGRKLFLKRNASPFLAALSAEGIVPKLVWTKRIETGEVVTAQHWKNGRELTREEMCSERVASLMKKIHTSGPLLTMLKKLGMKPMLPDLLLNKIQTSLSPKVNAHHTVRSAIQYLENEMPLIDEAFCTVCHGDVNHNNWLLSDQDELYLVDWEGAMIADPAIDLGMILYTYVEPDDWKGWLEDYGKPLDRNLMKRMKWYTLVQAITMIQWYEDHKRFKDMNDWIIFLNKVIQRDRFI